MTFFRAKRSEIQLLILDVQEKLFPTVEHPCPMMERMKILLEGCRLLDIPILLTEQYPKGLGKTIEAISSLLSDKVPRFEKTAFSAVKSQEFLAYVEKSPRRQWILAGLEAHVCVQQTAFDLMDLGCELFVVNDAISSRSIYDFSTGIAEMRDRGCRITSTEALLFELIEDAKHPIFKEFSNLIR